MKENLNRGKPIPDLKPGDVVFVNNNGLENMSRIQTLKSKDDDGWWITEDGKWWVLNDGGNSSFSILRKIQPKC